MILFSRDKEIIFKITNAVLLIWFIGALVFASNSLIDILVKKPVYTYDEYSTINCSYLSNGYDNTGNYKKADCERSYNSYLYSLKNEEYYDKVNLYTAIANVIVVGSTMYFINRKKQEK